MPRLSIVIPCLGGAAEFDSTLVSVLQNRPADCEVLVAHAEPYDDPYGLGHEVRFLHVPTSQLVAAINDAIHRCRGEVVHIVACGLHAEEGWVEPALAHFRDPDVAAVSPLILDATGQRVLAGGIRWSTGGLRRVVADRRLLLPGTARLRSSILGPTLAAAFYRRDIVVALGGFSAISDRLADVDLALAIRELGQLHVAEPNSRLRQISDPLRQSFDHAFDYGRDAERLFWRYERGKGLAASLVLHAAAAVIDCFRQGRPKHALVSLGGRAAALLEFGAMRLHEQRLALAKQRLTDLAQLRARVSARSTKTPPQPDVVSTRRAA